MNASRGQLVKSQRFSRVDVQGQRLHLSYIRVAQAGKKREKKLLGVPGKGAEISRRGVAEWDGDAYRPKGLHLAKSRR